MPGTRVEQLLASETHSPVDWLEKASFNDAADLLSRIPRDRRVALINEVEDRDHRNRLLQHQQFPVHSIGAIVTDFPLRIKGDLLAAEVLAEMRQLLNEDPGLLIIVDSSGRYLGVVDRWRLMIADPPAGTVQDYLVSIDPVRPEMPIVTVAQSKYWHTRNWLPVVDYKNRVLGGVSRERVFRTAAELANSSRTTDDVFTNLLKDLVYVFGDFLDWALLRRSAK